MVHVASLRRKKSQSALDSMQSLRRIGGFGLMMGASIITGYYLGSAIDRYLETYPIFMLLLIFLAIIGGFIHLFRNAGFLGGTQ